MSEVGQLESVFKNVVDHCIFLPSKEISTKHGSKKGKRQGEGNFKRQEYYIALR